jgi:hypothetical protein
MKGLSRARAIAMAVLVGAAAFIQSGQPAAAAVHAGNQSAAPRSAAPIVTNGAWTVYHRDDGHTGNDSTLPAATGASTGWVSTALDGTVYAEPLVYQGIVYVATLNNTVYALNQSDGSVVWSNHIRAPETGGWSCGNVSPQGIIGTPVIDATGGRIYVVTLDTTDDLYRLEGLNLVSGVVELSTVITTMAVSGFDWTIEQERGALALRNGYVYVPFGGRAGDCGAYHGYVFAVPINGRASLPPYITPGQGAGFWSAGGVVVDDSTGKVFETSGNGTAGGCNANGNGTPAFENDAVVRLSATVAHEDAFIPQDWRANWCINDQDLGSATMVLISPTLAFQAGKWGTGFLVNPQALGGMDGQLYPTPKPAGYVEANVCRGNHSDANFGSYAYAAPYVYLSCEGNGLVALHINTSTPSFSNCDATCAGPSWNAGGFSPGPPIVAGGAVWAVDTGGGGLYGFNAATGAQIYHSAGFGVTHFTTPSEAGGQIFVGSGNAVRSFNLTSGCSAATLASDKTSPQPGGALVTFTATATGSNCTNPIYQFWTWAPATGWILQQRYSATNSWTLNTSGLAPGTMSVDVWVEQSGSAAGAANYETFGLDAWTVGGCDSASLSPNPAPVAGTVVFTATAGGIGCGTPLYQFWMWSPPTGWVVKHAYSPTNTWSLDTNTLAGGTTYTIDVWVKQQGSPLIYETWALSSLPKGACGSTTITPTQASPQSVGGTINLSTAAAGCSAPQYRYWIYPGAGGTWQMLRDFSTVGTYNWNTAGLKPATYSLDVWVRQGGSTAAYDTFGLMSFSVTGASSATMSASPASPQAIGTPITLTASAPGSAPLYQFWIYLPGLGWTVRQNFSTMATYNWNTSSLNPGTYSWAVYVKQQGSSNVYDSYAILSVSVT